MIVPLLCDFGLDRLFVATHRRELLAHAGGDIHWSADGKSFDVIYDRRGIREDRDQAGGPVMYNLYPSFRTWKVADLSGQ